MKGRNMEKIKLQRTGSKQSIQQEAEPPGMRPWHISDTETDSQIETKPAVHHSSKLAVLQSSRRSQEHEKCSF